MKANGKQKPKIFKISEVELKKHESKKYSKKHSFQLISSRKYYLGTHKIAIVVNGIEMNQFDFELVNC